MLKQNLTFFSFLKLMVFFVNVGVYLWMTKDVWTKFRLKTTSTGTRIRVFESAEKLLPCFTFCALDAYKTPGLHYTSKQFVENTFDLEDFFEDETMLQIKNKSLYSLTQTWTVYYGRCHTACYLQKVRMELTSFYLKNTLDMKVFIHDKGDEFWTTLGFFPVDQEVLHLNFGVLLKTRVIAIGMTTRKKTFLPNENFPCQPYSEDFVKHCKPILWNIFKAQLNCSVAPIRDLATDGLPECSDMKSAVDAYYSLLSNIRFLHLNFPVNGCPVPCTQVSYKVEYDYFYQNTATNPRKVGPDTEDRFRLKIYYKTLNIEEKTEALVYDFGTFLAAIGGNLGLFLGFSCLSLLLILISMFEKCTKYCKFQSKPFM
jgi:hypothetical protein